MTISARGIIHFVDNEAYFISLEEWEREYRLYSELKKIKFFKNYKKWKNFSMWRKLRRRTQFKKRKQFLEANMFLIDDKLSRPLLQIRDYCCLIKNEMNIMDMNLKEPLDIDHFKEHENKHVVKQGAHIDLVVNEKVKELLETSCKESLDAFKEENRIRNKDSEEVDEDNQSPPLLVGDETNKEMPYTQEATIRTHYKRLKKFIRLVDYLVLDAKLSMMNNSMVKVSEYMEGNRDVLRLDYKNNGGFPTLINVRADFITEEIQYIPSSNDIKRIFDEVIILGVNHICGEHKMLLNSPEFSTYVNVGDNPNDGEEYTVDIYRLITLHDIYTRYKANSLQELESIFVYILEKSTDLKEVLEVVIRATNFGRKDLENKERADCYTYIERFMYDDEIIKRLTEKMDIGVFSFDRTHLKEKILNLSTDCLKLIETEMPDILLIRCNKFSDKMKNYIDLLGQPTMEVNQLVEHLDNYSECRDTLDKLNSEYSMIIGLSQLFSNDLYRIKIPDDTKNALEVVKSSRDKVRKMLEEIEARMDSEIKRGKKDLASMVPALETELTNLQLEVKSLDVNKEDHDPKDILQQLKPMKEEGERLVSTSKEYNFFQDKLDLPLSDIEKFGEYLTEITSYVDFWEMRLDWDENVDTWMATQVSQIDGSDLSEKIKSNINTCNVLLKEIEGNPMFRKFRTIVEEFKLIV